MATDEQISRAIAQTLKHFRAQKNLSQIALAEESGVHRTMVEKIESLKRRPTMHTIYRLCNAMDISVSEFTQKVDEILG
ncbi:helix-turn-helix transcriptional regulator [Gracilimonas sp.]|uniref:helix-turn-helix domain-containing protein n=1 Tax=Gracilimonas sp. TaxID=1974203 RepID=UPI0032F0429B